jgi:hypothetical protein
MHLSQLCKALRAKTQMVGRRQMTAQKMVVSLQMTVVLLKKRRK